MSDALHMKIVVSEDGPYVVTGEVPLSVQVITPNKQDQSWEWTEGRAFPAQSGYKLCRCGGSRSAPCAFARFCDVGGKIWSLIDETDNLKARALVVREANHCPSGRLVVHDRETGAEIEEALPPSIGLVEDPVLWCSGPLWVRGSIRVESANGKQFERRNRVTLCRCGASDNKPFCNGSHASVKFHDGLMA